MPPSRHLYRPWRPWRIFSGEETVSIKAMKNISNSIALLPIKVRHMRDWTWHVVLQRIRGERGSCLPVPCSCRAARQSCSCHRRRSKCMESRWFFQDKCVTHHHHCRDLHLFGGYKSAPPTAEWHRDPAKRRSPCNRQCLAYRPSVLPPYGQAAPTPRQCG